MEIASTLKRRWWMILAFALLSALCAFGLVTHRGPSYRATAILLVGQSPASGAGSSSSVDAAVLLTKSYSKLVATPLVLNRVIQELHLADTEPKLARRVSVKSDTDTQVIEVTVVAPNPEMAAAVANAVAAGFVISLSDFQSSQSSQVDQALRAATNEASQNLQKTSAELDALRNQTLTPAADLSAKIASLQQLQQQYQDTYTNLLQLQQRSAEARIGPQSLATVFAKAAAPTNRSGLSPLLASVIALVLGLAVAAAGVVLWDEAQHRIRSSRDVRRVAPTPVLATLGRLTPIVADSSLTLPGNGATDAFYVLSMRLLADGTAHNAAGRVVAVTSADVGGGEAASIVAARLALALAHIGQRVALIQANVPSPSPNDPLGGVHHLGLTDLLADDALRLATVLLPGPVLGLQILPAGRSRTGAIQLLTPSRLARVLAQAQSTSDVVVVDAPPLQTQPSTLAFAAIAAHTIIVAQLDATRLDALGALMDTLRSIGGQPYGVVLHSGVERGANGSGLAAQRHQAEDLLKTLRSAYLGSQP